MNLQSRQREEPDVNLTSLIDVVLLLLVFFMVSTSFVRESALTIRLPEAEPSELREQAPVEELEITVTTNGTYLVAGRALVNNRPDTLRRALEEVAAGRYDEAVVIRADAEASHQAVVTAMDVAGRLGFTEIDIATVSNPDAR